MPKIIKPADNVNCTKVFKEDNHGSVGREAQMNRHSLLFIAIGLIFIIVVSSFIVYTLSVPSGTSSGTLPSGALWQRSIENFAGSIAADDGKVFTSDNFDNLGCFDSQNGESIWNGTGDFFSGGLAVLGSQIYIGLEDRRVGCLDKNSGKLLWTFQNEQGPIAFLKGRLKSSLKMVDYLPYLTPLVPTMQPLGSFYGKQLRLGQVIRIVLGR